MVNFNNCTFAGNLTDEVEVRNVGTNKVVSNTIAVNRKYKDKNETLFLDFQCWGKLAEILGQYSGKGQPVLLHGELRQEKWTGNDGTKRVSYRLNVFNLQLLSSKDSNTINQVKSDNDESPSESDNDEIPF